MRNFGTQNLYHLFLICTESQVAFQVAAFGVGWRGAVGRYFWRGVGLGRLGGQYFLNFAVFLFKFKIFILPFLQNHPTPRPLQQRSFFVHPRCF